MTTIIDTTFKLFNINLININENEFEFQYESHPDYPSLLALVDTLTFFNIENSAFQADFNYLENLPTHFITLLNQESSKPQLQLIEKRNLEYFVYSNKKFRKIPTVKLQEKWLNVVLTISNNRAITDNKKSKSNTISYVLLAIFTFQLIYISNTTLFEKIFLLLPLLGLLFSVSALKDVFGSHSKIINSLCNISASTSCSSVLKSTKWRIFEILNISDLSISFFASQILLLFSSIIFGQGLEILHFQKTILYFSIPVLLLSLFYQKFIEKKWCPICLIINLIVISEILLLHFFINNKIDYLNQVLLFGFVFLAVYISWITLKQVLLTKKELKSSQLKSNRFEKNYDLFKLKLLTENKINAPTNGIILGNKKAKTNITIISNPFCGHCKEAHTILDKIVERNRENLNVKVILRTNLELIDDDSKKLFRGLIYLFYNKGEEAYINALNDWFEDYEIQKWIQKYYQEINFDEIDEILNSHLRWTNEVKYTFTPAIFINGYEYPKMYDRKNLPFFISEIFEDPDFN